MHMAYEWNWTTEYLIETYRGQMPGARIDTKL